MVVAALGQAGTTVRGAYDVLVSMGIINYFLPYLWMFAAMVKLQGQKAGPEVRRVPGGRPVAVLLAVVGFVSTAVTIVLSVIPADEEPNKPLAIAKVLVSTIVLIAAGAVTFWVGKRKRSALSVQRSESPSWRSAVSTAISGRFLPALDFPSRCAREEAPLARSSVWRREALRPLPARLIK